MTPFTFAIVGIEVEDERKEFRRDAAAALRISSRAVARAFLEDLIERRAAVELLKYAPMSHAQVEARSDAIKHELRRECETRALFDAPLA